MHVLSGKYKKTWNYLHYGCYYYNQRHKKAPEQESVCTIICISTDDNTASILSKAEHPFPPPVDAIKWLHFCSLYIMFK